VLGAEHPQLVGQEFPVRGGSSERVPPASPRLAAR
jgi:hypothetical protein